MREKKRVYDNYGGYVDFVPEEAGIMTEAEAEEKRIREEWSTSAERMLLAEIDRLRKREVEMETREALLLARIEQIEHPKTFSTTGTSIQIFDREEEIAKFARALTVAKAALVELRKFSHFSVCRFVQTDGVKTCDCPKGIVDGALKHFDEPP